MSALIASTVLMVEPIRFGFNEETAVSNAFQKRSEVLSQKAIQEQALAEFSNFVKCLENEGIEVIVIKDTVEPHTPDSIFPNNWFTSNSTGCLMTYPMATKNRSLERREDVLNLLIERYDYQLDRSLECFEEKGKFLEGTGSLLIDHFSKTVFVALSPRADQIVLDEYLRKSGTKLVSFKALGPKNELIYHTNVMLCIADEFAIIGADTIIAEDRERVCAKLKGLGKELIFLTNEQVHEHFAGNMLQLQNQKGEKFLVMSSRAKESLTSFQMKQIASFENKIIDVPLSVIEATGGGSARCMLAEIFNREA